VAETGQSNTFYVAPNVENLSGKRKNRPLVYRNLAVPAHRCRRRIPGGLTFTIRDLQMLVSENLRSRQPRYGTSANKISTSRDSA